MGEPATSFGVLFSMRILVTGGAGFTGSHGDELLASGHEVLALGDLSSGRRDNLDH